MDGLFYWLESRSRPIAKPSNACPKDKLFYRALCVNCGADPRQNGMGCLYFCVLCVCVCGFKNVCYFFYVSAQCFLFCKATQNV